ncbi:hypothetical protein DFH09DRAFT_1462387 [Mycena vulgaris]|nr:hypothetical protein DFH09DRAFT_1462387 [Mycena vulgaris]
MPLARDAVQGVLTVCEHPFKRDRDTEASTRYVFLDKTSTLTQNVMEFQKCSVNSIAYGEGVTEAQRGAATRAGRRQVQASQEDTMDPEELGAKLVGLKHRMFSTRERAWTNRYLQAEKLTLVSPALATALTDCGSPERPHFTAFLNTLAC